MAGDWLKWGIGLTEKREILEMASRLMIAPAHAAGIVMRCMEWVDQNVTEFDENCHAFVTLLRDICHACRRVNSTVQYM